MKRIAASALALGLLAAPAMAADIAPAAYSWEGFYAGIVGGYSWNKVEVDDVTFQDRGGPVEKTPIEYSTDVDGGQIGGTLGFNWQSGAFVLGAEGDISYSWANGDNDKYWGNPEGFKSESDIDWFGTARLRAGYAVDRALIYATGGLAYGNVEGTIHDNYGVDGIIDSSDSHGMWGWTIGGGLEYAVTDAVTLKAEYLYYDLGSQDFNFHEGSPGWDNIGSNVEVTGNIVRAGLNYRF